jgi:hypothetical protein
MPKRIPPLSDSQIKNAKPGLKVYQIYDGQGLYMDVDPSGGKWWRFKYQFDGEKRLSLGVYPEVSLLQAREKRAEYRKDAANGIDPGAKRKAAKTGRAELVANSFELVAREWLTKFIDPMSGSHRRRCHAYCHQQQRLH